MQEVIVIQPNQILQNKIKRVAAYARVSSNSEDQLHSYYSQIRYYTDIIAEMPNTAFAGIYADEGITGTQKSKRTEFLRLIKDCQHGKIDRIITKSVSRFARNTLESLETARMLKDIGVSIYFQEDHLDTATMDNEALLTLKSAAAQSGSMSISKNMKLGIRMRMKNGTFISSRVPYGYDYIERKTVVNPESAKLVRRIYDEYMEGYGLQTIALRLNKEGIPCGENAMMWHASHIYHILTNPKYVGDMIMQRSYTTDTLPYTKKINHGEMQWYYKHNTHEAIINRDVFMTVQKMLELRGKTHYKKPSSEAKPALWKKLICGECGHIYQRRVIRGKKYWACYYHKLNSFYCKAQPLSEETIYKTFCAMYNKLKANSDMLLAPAINQLKDMRERNINGNNRINEIDKQIAELAEQNLLITKLKNKGYMDDDDYLEQKSEIDAKLAELRKDRNVLLLDEYDETLDKLINLQKILEDSPAFMKNFMKDIFEELVENITVYDNKLTFRLYSGLELNENIRKEKRNGA